ncbi:MAG: AI-2E family transporter [Eubacteriales bacterium]|nr:AI-2E family transporter [Eubacteriales bacterium]
MSKFKEIFSDWRYLKLCFYITFTVGLLYTLYFIIKNIHLVFAAVSSVLGSILSALSPLFIGLFLAYLLNPLVDIIDTRLMNKFFVSLPKDPIKLEKRLHTRRVISILITFITIILLFCIIIYAFAFLIIGQFDFRSIPLMVESISTYFLQYEDTFRSLIDKLPDSGLEDQLKNVISNIADWIVAHFSAEAVIKFVASIGGSILNLLLGIVVAIYLIKDRDYFHRLWRKTLHVLLPMSISAKVSATLNDINTVLSQFLRGQLLDALIIAVLSSVTLTAIGLDFAVFIGCFAGLANVIPYFGPILGIIPAAIIGLLSEGISKAILAIVLLLVIQQIDSNIIYPKIVGSNTGLHPVFVLVAITFAGYFWGILGMLLAVPAAACIRLFIVRKIKDLD